MQEQQRGPVLFDALKQQHYQVGIFSSSPLSTPAFDKTVFQAVTLQRTGKADGETSGERDRTITDEFKEFIQLPSASPFFAFLFYDAAHSYCDKQRFAQPYQPAVASCNRLKFNAKTNPQPYLNRYKNALHYIDNLLDEVFASLKHQQLLAHTIVVITGDHGQEFNDNGLNYWEHASNYTPAQLQTPLIVYWPKRPAKIVDNRTSHYDIVPTLMKDGLGCRNPVSDYSVGMVLFNDNPRRYLIAGSYVNAAVIEPTRITTLYTTGQFQVTDLHNKRLPNALPHSKILQSAFADMRRFYQK